MTSTDWTEVRRLHFDEGIAKKELARRFGRDVKTIRRALQPDSAPDGQRRRRPRRLDPHRDEIMSWLRASPDISAREIAGRLRSRIGPISDRTVRKYVAEVRNDVAAGAASLPPAPAPADTEAPASSSAPPATPPPPVPVPVPTPAPPTPAPPTPAPPTPAARTPAERIVGPEPAPGEAPTREHTGCFLNRELTWLDFNFRVLHEAEDERTPLLERMKFISIVSSNLDEFFMKRIGGLKQQVGAHVHKRTLDGRTPSEQIEECCARVRVLERRKREALLRLIERLAQEGITLASYDDLSEEDRASLREYYVENIFPLVTPQATDPAHPFPFISNLSVNLLVTLRYSGDETDSLARVKIPVGAGIPRFVQVRNRLVFVRMESIVARNLDLLFPGMDIEGYSVFRVTRNANTEVDEEHADDLLGMIESELRERRFAPIVRLQVEKGMDPHKRGLLAAELGLDEHTDVFEVEGMIGMRDVMELRAHDALQRPDLLDPPHHPVDHGDLTPDRNLFHTIRDAGSILLMHPYQSYPASVERFLSEAAADPKVRAIKMTLYRTSAESMAIDYLIEAARNKKQVAVVVELKARFDEEANIRWASRLEAVGIHVTYGVVGLKTHCKSILVVRQDYDRLRRYAHLGTGNYHAGTARLYSDVGLLTCDDAIGRDLTELFNYLTTGFKPRRKYTKLLPAPKHAKQALLAKIAREIEGHSEDSPGLIQIKTNAIEDGEVTLALYRASQAGVRVDLIVRDSCRVRVGVPGLSDNIQVIGIVGRFLEHTRIYHFRNGGAEEYYIGSADCMKRNLDSRVEILVPVEDPSLQRDLRLFLDTQLRDSRSAWDMQPDGSYVQRQPESDKNGKGCQQSMIDWAEKRLRQATRLKRRKPRGIERRNVR